MLPSFPVGTIGHCLAHGAPALLGLSVKHGRTSLTITQTHLVPEQVLPGSIMLTYGISIDVVHGETKETIALTKNDHAGNLHDLLHKNVEMREEALKNQLLVWAETYDQHFSLPSTDPISWVLNAHNELPILLACLLMAPRPGSLVVWAHSELKESSFKPISANYKGHSIVLTVQNYGPPDVSLGMMESTVGFSVETDPPREKDTFWGDPWMYLGVVADAWLERNGPTTHEDLAYVEKLLETWHRDTSRYLHWSLAKSGFACLSGAHWQFNMPTFWIFDLLTYYLEHGPPSAPPVPAWTPAQIARAASIVKRANATTIAEITKQLGNNTSQPFAVYDLNGYTVVLADDSSRPMPHYAFSILLRAPGSEHFVPILMNDVWNPQAARAIDGDAFALRRFVEWLRAAIKKNKLNERVVFEGEDEDTEKIKKTSIWITDWLLFGHPEFTEDCLVDWRCQRYVVPAGKDRGTLCFAGIYGFGADTQRRIVEEDIPMWRRFLREIVDARFTYAWG